MSSSTDLLQDAPPNLYRKGKEWLKKTGIGHTGKKAKRLIHRRDRHHIRHQLRELSGQ
jgi:hypothetical protein